MSAGEGNDFDRILGDLRRIGVRRGSVLIVQASLRAVAPVTGDPEIVVRALLELLGSGGTLVVPTFTSFNSTTSRAHKEKVAHMTDEERESYVDSLPIFDPFKSPSEGMGALAEHVRTRPDAVRSTHPHTSFAAVGRWAVDLMKVHDLDCHLGRRSPVGRLYELDADTLLLGLDYAQACTMIHFAEYLAAEEQAKRGLIIEPRAYRARMSDAQALDKWVTFVDLDLDDGDFDRIGVDFEAMAGVGRGPGRGLVGSAPSKLVNSRQMVHFAKKWMLANRRPAMAQQPEAQAEAEAGIKVEAACAA